MATLSLTNDEVYGHLGFFLSISRNPDDWDDQTEEDVQRIIRSGKRKFFGAHNWGWLEQAFTVVTLAPQTTGTIAIVNGVVTLTGATFATDLVANYVIVPDGGGVYKFASRTSTTVATLYDTSVNVDALSTYALYKVNYAMPANFGGWLDPITRENNTCVHEMATIPEWEVRAFANRNTVREGAPEAFSVSQFQADEETGIPTYYLTVYPLPNAVHILYSRIRIQPGDTLDMDNDVSIVHPVFAECLLEAILAAAEVHANDTKGVHADRFTEILVDAVKKDNAMRGTRSLKPRDPMVRDPNFQLLVAPVEYNEL